MPRKTNPVQEIYELCRLFEAKQANPSNENTLKTLAKIFSVEPNSQEFFLILSALSRRFLMAKEAVSFGSNLSHELKMNAVLKIDKLSAIIDPGRFSEGWNGLSSSIIKAEYMEALPYVSEVIARRYWTSVIDKQAKKELLVSIEVALSNTAGVRGPRINSLVSSLAMLKLVVEKIEFFGIHELELEFAKSCYYFERELSEKGSGKSDKWKTFVKLTMAALVCVSVVIQETAETVQALEYLSDKAFDENLLDDKSNIRKLPAPPRLLPKPPPDDIGTA